MFGMAGRVANRRPSGPGGSHGSTLPRRRSDRPGSRVGVMAEWFLDCRNLTAYFYKWWQVTLGEVNDASDSKQRETANRKAYGFKRAYFTARKWLYEHTDVPETNIHALIEKKHGGSCILIAPARRALEALDEQGENLKLLAFMWEHYPAQCNAIELPRPAKRKQRANGNGSSAQGAAERKQRRRGPPTVHDPKADAKLLHDWQAARRQGANRKQFCESRGIKLKALIGAQTRKRELRQRVR